MIDAETHRTYALTAPSPQAGVGLTAPNAPFRKGEESTHENPSRRARSICLWMRYEIARIIRIVNNSG